MSPRRRPTRAVCGWCERTAVTRRLQLCSGLPSLATRGAPSFRARRLLQMFLMDSVIVSVLPVAPSLFIHLPPLQLLFVTTHAHTAVNTGCHCVVDEGIVLFMGTNCVCRLDSVRPP